MTRPRPVYPGAINFSTRCVHKRQFLLRPSKEVNRIIEYTTAVVCERYGIELHALCVESGHKHDVSTDPHGNVVDFERDLHEFITRQINRLYRESGGIWERRPSGRAECLTPDKVLEKIVYTMTNPVKDRPQCAVSLRHLEDAPLLRRLLSAAARVDRERCAARRFTSLRAVGSGCARHPCARSC